MPHTCASIIAFPGRLFMLMTIFVDAGKMNILLSMIVYIAHKISADSRSSMYKSIDLAKLPKHHNSRIVKIWKTTVLVHEFLGIGSRVMI